MREMKDSGVEWIGEIPVDKTVLRNKYNFTYEKGKLPISTNIEKNGFPYIGASDLDSDDEYSTYTDDESLPDSEYDDLLVLWDGARAGLCGTHKVGKISSTVVKIRGNKATYSPFLYWYYKGFENFMFQSVNGTTIPHMNRRYVEMMGWIDWTLEEQYCITDYLDEKCNKIDTIIAIQQEIIKKLNAYKLSLITETVTKGLNSDVELKDSGIEFIGKIPSHWKIIRLKFLLTYLIDCPHETPKYDADGKYLVVRTADQDLAILRKDEDMFKLSENEYQNRIRRMSLDKDDIVYGREGGRWGLACLVPESNRYCLGQRMLQFRCDRELFNPQFAVYALSSSTVYLQGSFDTMGSASPHVNISTVQNYVIVIPPIQEQEYIAKELQKKCKNIDFEIKRRQRFIDKIIEYKKSLIYEVVTGKREF